MVKKDGLNEGDDISGNGPRSDDGDTVDTLDGFILDMAVCDTDGV